MSSVKISDYINNEYKDYSKYVLYSRAIPNVIDGLKPSQRKILYTANKVCKTNRIKTASLSGNTISLASYHHGDASLNDAINKMVAPYSNNLPLLLGEGSFGSRLVPEPAAARYTYTKLSPNFNKYFLDNDILESSPDPEDPEPRFYLPSIPWVLVNGVSGIAVGFATEIQPRNPIQLKKLCVDYIKGKNIDKVKIPPYFEGFNGTIIEESDKWVCKGVYVIKGTKISITEVPIGFDREKYVIVLDKLVTDGKIVGYKDKCNKHGFNFEVTMRRGKALTDNQIITLFRLSKNLNENLTTIDESGNVKIFDNVNDIIKHFCDYRLSCYDRRYAYYIERDSITLKIKIEILKFIGMVLNGDIILKGKNKSQLQNELEKNKFVYIDRLLNLPVYRLCNDEIEQLLIDKDAIVEGIKRWENMDMKKAYLEDLK